LKPPSRSPQQHALALLTRREHSRAELARKLRTRGHDGEAVDAAIERLAADGWQDDARFAESLLRHRTANGYGPRWIRAELATHGLSDAIIETALAAFDGDWTDVARNLLSRRNLAPHDDNVPLPSAHQRKAIDLLLRRGFDRNTIAIVLKA